MLWLLVQGATVARARRWPGALRWLSLAGGLWFPVAIAGLAAGEWPGLVVSNVWLVATFVPLGLLLVVRAGTVDPTREPMPGANVGSASLQS